MNKQSTRMVGTLFGVFLLASCGAAETNAVQDAEAEQPEALAFADDEAQPADDEVLADDAVVLSNAPAQTCTFGGDESLSFETLAGVSCEQIMDTAENILVPFGYSADTDGFFREVSSLCQDDGEQVAYHAQSPQVPALADAIVGRLCPGDRALIVEGV